MVVAMRTATKEHSEHEPIATADPFPRGRAALHVMLRDDNGQTFGEYGLILALVVLVAMAGLATFGAGLGTKITNTINAVVAVM